MIDKDGLAVTSVRQWKVMMKKWIFRNTHPKCQDHNRDEGTNECQDLAESEGNVKGSGDAGAYGHDVENGLVPRWCGVEESCVDADVPNDGRCCGHGSNICEGG